MSVTKLDRGRTLARRRKPTAGDFLALLDSQLLNDPQTAIHGKPEMHERVKHIIGRQNERNKQRSAAWGKKGTRRYEG